MKSLSSPDGLTLTDSPGCFWLFGAFFCGIGGASILAAISSMAEYYPAWQIGLAVGLGLAAMAAGIYLIYNAPGSRVVIRKTRNEFNVSHRGLFRREELSFRLNDIRGIYIVQGKDIDGDPVFTIRFQSTDGRELPLTHLWLHDRENLEYTLALLGEYLPIGEIEEAGAIGKLRR
jgi:hypothetical protein